mmetsp:Transcript_84200/g.238567  ORF Transcript_84200/g.238567 Transcript_84200/m.238567 type:complete len:88 (-) Transcript_84200:216-479(-)
MSRSSCMPSSVWGRVEARLRERAGGERAERTEGEGERTDITSLSSSSARTAHTVPSSGWPAMPERSSIGKDSFGRGGADHVRGGAAQ